MATAGKLKSVIVGYMNHFIERFNPLQNTLNVNGLEMTTNLPKVRRVRSNRTPLDEKKYDEENLSPLKPIYDNLFLLKAIAFPFKVIH